MISPKSLLKKRVRKTEAGGIVSRYAAFRRQGQFFGLPIDLIREVLPGQPLTRVARAQEQILGVMSLRGEILPVVVIDEWLGLMLQTDDLTLPILVLRRGELLVGLRVDAIQSVVNVPQREVQAHPTAAAGAFLSGIWQPTDRPPINLIDGVALIEALCHQTSVNT
jgi:purine-binding chemotaxis protein CheW